MVRPNFKLLSRYLSSRYTASEKRRVEKWINSNLENKEFFDRLKQVWEVSGRIGTEWDFSRSIQKLGTMIERSERASQTDSNFRLYRIARRPFTSRIAFGAIFRNAAVIVALFGALYADQFLKEKALQQQALQRDAMVVWKEASTGQGQQMTLHLSDGTKIVLNSATRLKYIDQGDGPRDVYLEGEAYFQVVHSSLRPFMVHVNNETINDIGTKFDVRAWSEDKNTRVAVVEGAVSIHPDAPAARDVVLSRNQYCIVNGTGVILPPTYTDVARDVDWMEGKLVFHDASMSDVMKQIRRKYGLYCIVADTSILSRRITTTFDRQDPPKRIVSIIAVTLDLTCEVSGDSVLFMDSKGTIPDRIFPQKPIEKQQ